MPRIMDLRTKRFGKLVAVTCLGAPDGRFAAWICRCDCGNEVTLTSKNLLWNKRTCCGCSRPPKLPKPALYMTWYNMIRRCENPRDPYYHCYGARGISVCERWHDVWKFIADVGPKPSPEYTLDRIDGTKGYSPDNVRWATPSEQARNKRTTRWITAFGLTKPLIEWTRDLGCGEGVITSRIQRGWTVEDAISTPPRALRSR